MYSIIRSELNQPLYKNYEQLEKAVLSFDKTNGLLASMHLALRANDIGEAFVIGYRCALQSLLPSLVQDQWAAMCVSEKNGNHPKLLMTQVDDQGVLNGHKSFITMADQARQLVVIAKAGQGAEQPILKAVLIDQKLVGVSTELMPPLPMVPDIKHGQISFENAQGVLLEGDGYADYSKRFRTLEDIHVFMAFSAMILRKCIELKLDPEYIQDCLQIISSLGSMQDIKLENEHLVHLTLASCFKRFELLCNEFELTLQEADSDFYTLWMRDKKLFTIAAKARVSRSKKAQARLLG